MGPFLKRHASTAPLSTTALAAILTGVGVVMLGLLVGLVALLIQAVRKHKRLLADLEERGVIIAQSQNDAKDESVSKPRAVLRRNTILPFNPRSGWGALPSVETINSQEPTSAPPHYAPPKPVGFISKSKRLSWPCSARRSSGRMIHMRKIRVPVLSTVIESPKPSPLVPVLSGALRSETPSPKKSNSRPSSDQSLLQHHPAFRQMEQTPTQETNLQLEGPHSEPLRRSLTARPISKGETYIRPNRSRSVTEMSIVNKPGVMSRVPRPKLHTRSTSTCSQSSGHAPDGGLPPLPLAVTRIENESRKRSTLSRSPSRLSNSSFESAGSSILATHPSPTMRASNARVQKVTKRQWRSAMVVGPRPLRDTLTLHGMNHLSQSSIKSSTARFSSTTQLIHGEPQVEKRNSLLTNSSSLQSVGRLKTAESVTMSKVSTPAGSPLTVRSMVTPKRRSGSHVTPYGSPEDRRKRSSILNSASGNSGAPKRQLSQTSTQASSTRSSYGNPFQWDPAPMSAGRPSALKGSPGARKGHKWHQNSVRISLVPTMLGPSSRPPSQSGISDIQVSPKSPSRKNVDLGNGSASMRSLPRPPSTPTFEPDLRMRRSPGRVSLHHPSPSPTRRHYDHGPVGSPVGSQPMHCLRGSPERERKRLSNTSIISIPTFPSPCHDREPARDVISPPPKIALTQPSTESSGDTSPSDVVCGASSPFEMLLDIRAPPGQPLLTEAYDPERPQLIWQVPMTVPSQNFSSPFTTCPEEPSAEPNQLATYQQWAPEDSPPCSPKTIPPPTFAALNGSAYHLPIKDTTIPEEPLDTIDPAILSKEAFNSLNTPFDTKNNSIIKSPISPRNSIPIPASPSSAKLMFESQLDTALPSDPTVEEDIASTMAFVRPRSDTQATLDTPKLSLQSPPRSAYSFPIMPSMPSPNAPCSPRPRHAELPPPSINFNDMPTLSPTPSGPRSSPPRSLRCSIQKLRRMNSDAEKGGRGERRYLRLGREDSIALPGEESWLEPLDVEDEGETWDERRLVGDILNDWEDEAATLELEASQKDEKASPPRGNTEVESQKKVEEPKDARPSSISKGSSPAFNRSSSIWEDGEKFWTSTPPYIPPNSPNKPKQRFLPLSSSPLATPTHKPSTPSRKRHFEVARDDSATQENGDTEAGRDRTYSSDRYRKRSALGVSTANVRIQVQPPSSARSESLYDVDGFLRS